MAILESTIAPVALKMPIQYGLSLLLTAPLTLGEQKANMVLLVGTARSDFP